MIIVQNQGRNLKICLLMKFVRTLVKQSTKAFYRNKIIHLIDFFLIPLKPNGISRSYQLDWSISVLRVIGCIFFPFYLNNDTCITLCKQTAETLIRRSALQRLIGFCTIRYVPQKDARYIWVLLDFSLTVKAAPHKCVIRTIQP